MSATDRRYPLRWSLRSVTRINVLSLALPGKLKANKRNLKLGNLEHYRNLEKFREKMTKWCRVDGY